jgi:hypothetical protein
LKPKARHIPLDLLAANWNGCQDSHRLGGSFAAVTVVSGPGLKGGARPAAVLAILAMLAANLSLKKLGLSGFHPVASM